MTITVLYSCPSCHTEKAPLDVPARAPLEDIIAWTQQTIGHVSRAHDQRSPRCPSPGPFDLYIPLPKSDRDRIGEVTSH
jgi:hypothetical protein